LIERGVPRAGVHPGYDAVDVLEDQFQSGLASGFAGFVGLGGCGGVLGRQGGDEGLGFG
jgi:hypothetical protein